MTSNETILATARKVILSESESIRKLTDYLDLGFTETAKLIFNSKGRLIVTGIGKSAIIAQKIVATMNSTGTPAMFLHASEAIHGDLGMVQHQTWSYASRKAATVPKLKFWYRF